VHDSSESADISLRHGSGLHANDIIDVAAKPVTDSLGGSFHAGPPFHGTELHGFAHVVDGHIIVDDAHLLFSGTYSKSGNDLVLSDAGRDITVHDYFKGEHHPALYTPDGASLSGRAIDALAGHTVYAQATPAQAANAAIGHVVKLSGSASVVRNGVTVELNIGDNVFKSDVVQSGLNSALGITFIDGTAFSLGSNARMVLNDMVYDPNGSSNSSFLSLVQGAITFVAGQTAKNGSMKIDTPVATMGIRGTAVLVDISANDGPTRFSILVEPGNHVGSYELFNKVTGEKLGTISQAGMVTILTPAGFNQLSITEQAKTLADLQAEKDIIQQVFSIAFPKFNDANPKSHFSSHGSGITPFGDDSFYPFNPFAPPDTKLALTSVPDSQGNTNFTINIFVDPPPTVFVTNAKTFQFGGVGNVEDSQASTPGDKSFKIADHVTIIDPSVNAPPFFDVAIPYVAGTAKLTSVSGPSTLPAGFDLKDLIAINLVTGVVTYDPSKFQFLGLGEKVVYTISFDAYGGPVTAHPNSNLPYTVPETLTFTVDGLNDAPVFTASVVSAPLTETPHLTGSASPLAETILLPFLDQDFSDVAAGYSVSVLHTSASGVTTGLPQDSATLDAELRSFLTLEGLSKNLNAINGQITEYFSAPDKTFDYLAAGETLTLTYTIQVTDAHGATGTETLNITVTGTNDAPVIATVDLAQTATLTEVAGQTGVTTPDQSHPAGGVIHFADVDLTDRPTASITAQTASYLAADGTTILTLTALQLAAIEQAFAITPEAGNTDNGAIDWSYKIPDNALDFLAAGETVSLVSTVTVDDHHGGTAAATVTVTITGTNDKAVIGDPTVASVTENAGVDGKGNLVATGIIPISDADHDQNAFQTTVVAAAGDLGSLTLNADGSYTYTVANQAVQYLSEGEIKTDTFTVTSVDGTTKDVSFVIHGVNEAPIIDTHGAVLSYTADHSAKVVDAALTVTDVDSADLTGATVAITGHYHAGQDHLLFADQTFDDGGQIHGAFDAGTGVLTLTGTASVADYQVALDSVEYSNSRDHASSHTRTISFTVSDGSVNNATSNTGTVDVNITPQDHRPVAAPDNIIVSSHAFTSVDSHHDLGITFADSVLLANDSGGFLLHVRDFPTGPSHGSIDDDFGSVTYVLDHNSDLPTTPDGTLTDSFSYRAADIHGTSAPAQVTLTIVDSDTLIGTSGDDIIIGANNTPERIDGGAGNDILVGGHSVQARNGDTFVFAPGSGHDTIINFQHGVDKIELDYFNVPTASPNWFSQWAASGAVVHQGSDTLLVLDTNDPTHHDTILLKNVTHLSANDFIIHPSGGGNA
jgi:VCBS repeat-containing protein